MDKINTCHTIDAQGALDVMQLQNGTDSIKRLSLQDVKSKKDMEKATGGFEALMLQEMLKSMWNTVEFSGLLDENSFESGVYRDMLNQAIADSVSEGRGIGVKEFLSKEIAKIEGNKDENK